MKKKNLEKLILSKHKQAICKRKDREIWYTRDPEDLSKKISANSLDGLYQKLYTKYYGMSVSTVADLYPHWEEWHCRRKGIVEITRIRYEQVFNRYIRDSFIGKMAVTSIRGNDIDAFFAEMSEKVNRHTVTNIKTILNGIYDYAIAFNVVSVNLARQFSTRTIKTKAERLSQYNVFTDEDRAKLLAHLENSDNPYDLAICLMFCLCCRVGEINALHWEDVDYEHNRILIHREIVRRQGEDGKMHCIEVPHTKTGRDSGVRSLILSPRATGILKRASALNTGDGYIFTSSPSGSPLFTKTLNAHLKAACAAVDIPYRSSHKIRFWAASMAANGADISTLMATGGWADKSTALYYQRRIAVEQNSAAIWNKSFN